MVKTPKWGRLRFDLMLPQNTFFLPLVDQGVSQDPRTIMEPEGRE
jgi:hypothetical protein